MLAWPLVAELLLLGSATGFLAGLLGIGGGMLLVPFITLLLTLKQFPPELIVKMAVATSLATILFTSIASVRAHHARGAVRWDIVRRFAPGIVLGSLIGAQLAKLLPARPLTLLFAAFVAFSATQMLLERKPKAARQLPPAPGMFGTGGLIGVLSSLVGAGGAFISVPFMTWCNVPLHTAVATSSALGFPVALAGTVGYIVAGWDLQGLPSGTLGFLYLPALVVVSTASVLTAPLGARVSHSIDVRKLRRLFSLLLYGVAAYMLHRGLRS
ncbi:sulfite exporter TauE/SafE family protein [Methylibium sp.]|uniref:sulfite exporter TauE/SafE family protein n=1 Tax=Methylibium sp. TaxID=2067992 RepID=UPI00286B4B62|nr:sulfite exporter TauE/SafE family protein [Methylibium sp.]